MATKEDQKFTGWVYNCPDTRIRSRTFYHVRNQFYKHNNQELYDQGKGRDHLIASSEYLAFHQINQQIGGLRAFR